VGWRDLPKLAGEPQMSRMIETLASKEDDFPSQNRGPDAMDVLGRQWLANVDTVHLGTSPARNWQDYYRRGVIFRHRPTPSTDPTQLAGL
jgi:hypothetical protein